MRRLSVRVPGSSSPEIVLLAPGPPADELFAESARGLQQPMQRFCGTDFAVADPFGNHIRIVQPPPAPSAPSACDRAPDPTEPDPMRRNPMRSLFVNLPVQDLSAAKAFFAALGFTYNDRFSDENAACMVVAENISVMLLTQPFFKGFINSEICERDRTETLLCLSAESLYMDPAGL